MRQPCTILYMAKPSNTYAGDKALIALGAAIRRARLQVNLSQEGLAADAEMDRSYVGGIERGEHYLTFMNLKKLANALGVKSSRLLESAGL